MKKLTTFLIPMLMVAAFAIADDTNTTRDDQDKLDEVTKLEETMGDVGAEASPFYEPMDLELAHGGGKGHGGGHGHGKGHGHGGGHGHGHGGGYCPPGKYCPPPKYCPPYQPCPPTWPGNGGGWRYKFRCWAYSGGHNSQNYEGEGFNEMSARQNALNKCQSYTHGSCAVRYCRNFRMN